MDINFSIILSNQERKTLLDLIDVIREPFLQEMAICKEDEDSCSYTLKEYEAMADLLQRFSDL